MKKIIYICQCLLMSILFINCSDFLEVEAPKDQIDRKKVFNDDALATAAVTNIYTLLRDNGLLSGGTNGIGFLMACYTDELEVTDPQTVAYKNFYYNTVNSNNTAVNELWKQSYKQLYSVNDALEGISESTALSDAVSNQLKGELLTLRGILHFYLSQTFGEIPYVTNTNYNLNKSIGKIHPHEVLQLSIEDLVEAETLLTTNYPSAERVRINQSVTQAFLARMFLYQKNWPLAMLYAQKVIEQPIYELESLDALFFKDSKSAIWQFKPIQEGVNAKEGETYIFESLPAPYVRLSQHFIQRFDSIDLRKDLWIKKIGDSNENYCAYKYKNRGSTASSEEYSIVVRLEEMYLIAAEAAAEMSQWEECNYYINQIRVRAGLSPITATNRHTAISYILNERNLELFCEHGHRFFDLKRRDQLDQLLSVKPNWKAHYELLPLPENELLLNPKLLPQNNGY